MRFERLKNVTLLIGLYALCFSFFAVDGCAGGGGPVGGPVGVASTQPTARDVAFAALTEANAAYTAAETLAIDLHQAGVISDATLLESQAYFSTAGKSLDAAHAIVVGGGPGDYLLAVADVWGALDAAAAIHSPAAPKPSTRRKH